MEKKIIFEYQGQLSQVGELTVNRLIPNRYLHAVGPVVFLDYLMPKFREPMKPRRPDGKFAHPHRGIATFTYLISGEVEHFDSYGNHGIVGAGGAQWMKAGNGIIHDENPSTAFQEKGGWMHGFQFWVNLPSASKKEKPEYMGIQKEEVPEIALPGNAGIQRILIGEAGGLRSKVKTFNQEFIFHIRLNPGASYHQHTHLDFEYAVFSLSDGLHIQDSVLQKEVVFTLCKEGDEIRISNNSDSVAEFILFGGAIYNEPIVPDGPFIMNSLTEVGEAYRDFMNGKYGVIEYEKSGTV